MFGWKESGSNGIHTHAGGRPFASEEIGKIQNGGLGGGVGHNAGERNVCGGAGDIDDAPSTCIHHCLADDLAWEQRPTNEVEIEARCPILSGYLREGIFRCHGDAWVVSTGSIHENGWNSEPLCGCLKKLLKALTVGGIALDECCASAGFLDFRRALGAAFRISPSHHHGGSGGGEGDRHATTEDARCSNNHSHFFGEIKKVCCHISATKNKAACARTVFFDLDSRWQR